MARSKMVPIKLELDPNLVAKIDALAGDVPRVRFIRAAIVQFVADLEGRSPDEVSAAYQGLPSPDVARVRSSAEAKRDIQPILKKG